MELLIKNGRLIDPKTETDEYLDVLIKDGVIIDIGKTISGENKQVLNVEGMIITPGFVDLHVHLREPGFEFKETIESGTRAAAAGGFTTIACMPNTNPAIHSKDVVEYIQKKNEEAGLINVAVIGSITKNIEGEELSPIEELVKSGVIAISDDGKTPMKEHLVKQAFERAALYSIPIISHCEDHELSKDGSVNLGNASERTNMKGIPPEAEYLIVKRDIEMSKATKARLHIAHVSVKESLDLIRTAKESNLNVTCEICPHHFILTDDIVNRDDTSSKVNPPIRGGKDVLAMLEGIKDGTIDIIATDHAPHDEESKNVDYERAAFGISGLETAFSLSYSELVLKNHISLMTLIEMMTINPCKIGGLDKGTIEIGKAADITILDLNKEQTIDSSKFHSKGRNTPFNGNSTKGRVMYTIAGGRVIYERGKILCS